MNRRIFPEYVDFDDDTEGKQPTTTTFVAAEANSCTLAR